MSRSTARAWTALHRAIGKSVLLCAALCATPAVAGVGGAAGPTWPPSLTVGGNISGFIDIYNASTGSNGSEIVDILSIYFTPSCSTAALGSCTTPDPGVFSIYTPVGAPGTSCANVFFTPVGPDATGRYQFVPSKPIHLGPSDGSGGAADPPHCRIVISAIVDNEPVDSTPPDLPKTTFQFVRATIIGHTSGATGASGGQATVAISPAPPVNLVITKTNDGTDVTVGAALVYTLVVSNLGPNAADGAILRDPAAPGLFKTGTPTCGSEVGGAVCPTSTLTNANLESAGGVVIPTLPADGSLTFTIFATVQAAP